MEAKYVLGAALIAIVLGFSHSDVQAQPFVREAKPWTYWWWMGSAVDKRGITENLEALCRAGIGGVHIVPIYGEKGDEDNFIPFLSPEWMEMLIYTAEETDRLGMGLDMTPGTGWPFGGPWVTEENAAKSFFVKKIKSLEKTNIYEYVEPGQGIALISLAAYDKEGRYTDITSIVSREGNIDWSRVQTADEIFAMFRKPTGQTVKRAAPGGEGKVIDYLDKNSLLDYFGRFSAAFSKAGLSPGKVRGFYNDSYEIYGANWTNNFFEEFQRRRGYDLHPYIRRLGDTSENIISERVATDYCETWSDMLRDIFTRTWVDKSHEMGFITRNAAHKSPGNWLDQYALADIPETEAYGSSDLSFKGLRTRADWGRGGPSRLMMKFASSAANIQGRRMVSSETATWLDDHFKVSLSQVKPQIDELFLSGTNHVFFHGVTYSPFSKPFPGKLFYTSTNFGPTSHFWNELPALTRYIADCQQVLQHSSADNDILLYYPMHEIWRKQHSDIVIKLIGPENASTWMTNTPFGNLAEKLLNKGYSFDYVSDSMIRALRVDHGVIRSVGASYKAIVIPECHSMPVETLSALLELAKNGALLFFEKAMPADVPGLFEVEKRKARLREIEAQMIVMKETVSMSDPIFERLTAKKIHAEEMAAKGLRFLRKKSGEDRIYFIANQEDKFQEGWILLDKDYKAVEIFDPVSQKRGKAALKRVANGVEIYLQLPPGQSCILRCTANALEGDDWEYWQPRQKQKLALKGPWTVTPVEGAPVVPKPVTAPSFTSWTNFGDDYARFSGKAIYAANFLAPEKYLSGQSFLLDLGNVRETARVRINGMDLGLIWCLPNRLIIPEGVVKSKNTIEIEVVNLSINRIIDMDRRGVKWKNFYDVNMINIHGRPYDASLEKPESAGLLSPIYLIPADKKQLTK